VSNHEMAIQIARAEGVMRALYGICRDLVIGCSVDEDKNGKLGDVIGDAIHGLIQVYNELEKVETEPNISTEQEIDEFVGYAPDDVGKILNEDADLE